MWNCSSVEHHIVDHKVECQERSPMDIEDQISRLKAKHGAKTDQDLAHALGLGKSAVGAWRARGSIPHRYVRSLDSDVPLASEARELAPLVGGSARDAAVELALLRFFKKHGDIFGAYHVFLEGSRMAAADFWTTLRHAERDVVARMNDHDDPADRAVSILALREFSPE